VFFVIINHFPEAIWHSDLILQMENIKHI